MSDRKVLVRNVSNGLQQFIYQMKTLEELLKIEDLKYLYLLIFYSGRFNESGVEVLFKDGYLMIDNKQDRIDLGLEEADEEIFEMKVKSDEEIFGNIKNT